MTPEEQARLEADERLKAQAAADKAAAKAATAKPKEPKKPVDDHASGGVIWVQPGHPQYAVGQYVPADAATASTLRAKGYARHATEDEVGMNASEGG